MPTIPPIEVPAQYAADALEALEKRWKSDAVRIFGQAAYDAMSGTAKAQACLKAEIRVSVRNLHRERAERAISVTEVELP